MDILQRHGVEVERTSEALTVERASDRYGSDLARTEIPAGSLVIPSAQPRSALLRSLLESNIPMEGEFLELAREKIDRNLNPRFYDVTAWSLPQFFDLDLVRVDGQLLAKTDRAALERGERRDLRRPQGDSHYAYVLPGEQTASRAAAWHLRDQGFRLSFLTGDTVIDGLEIHSGSVIVRVGQNSGEIHAAVRAVCDRFNLDLDAVSTGWSPAGILNLGAPDITVPLAPSNIALVSDDPVLALSFGFAWYLLDQQYQIPTTVIRAASVGDTDLSEFDVVVIPELTNRKKMVDLLGESGAARLEQWLGDGGTLVALGSAVELVRDDLDLIELGSFYDPAEKKSKKKSDSAEDDKDEQASPADPPIRRFGVPGAVYDATVDRWQWLAAGYGDSMPFMVASNRLYRAPDQPPSNSHRVVVSIDEDAELEAGFAWPESQERLPGSVLVYEQRVGSGRVIAFAEDPNFRGFWRGADRLFLNAVVVGPSAP